MKYQIKWAGRYAIGMLHRALPRVLGVPRTKMLSTWILHRRRIDLEHPRKLNEKILWLAYHTDTSCWSRLADKAAVREYVRERGLEEILVPVYGVYDWFEDMDWAALPERFVLKATHGCDMNFICREKSKADPRTVAGKARFWLGMDLQWMALEPHYGAIPRRLLCEQLLPGEITDHKCFCMDGKVRFIEVCSQREHGPYLDVFEPDWTPRPDAVVGAKHSPVAIERPECLDEMIRVAERLAQGLPFVRVDLYQVDGRVYFGEMTFTPAGGVLFRFSEEFLAEQGEYLKIDGE